MKSRKQKINTDASRTNDLPKISASIKTSVGETIQLKGDIWFAKSNREGRGQVSLNIGQLRHPRDTSVARPYKRASPRRKSVFTNRILHTMILHITYVLKSKKPATANLVLAAFKNLDRFVHDQLVWSRKRRQFCISDLTADVFEQLKAHLDNELSGSQYGVFLRGFYKWGLAEQIAGFELGTLKRMKRVNISPTLSGRVAQIRDPKTGALVWEEERQVVKGIDSGAGSDQARATVMLFWETGIRPEASIVIRNCDLVNSPNEDVWWIMAPKVKQRRPTTKRDRHAISARLGELLWRLRERPSDGKAFLLHWFNDPKAPTNQVRKAVANWALDAELTTIRLSPTGSSSPLPLTPYRFRRTMATNMAERGASAEEIAEALGDQSLAMAAVYAATSSSIVEILAQTLDQHPAWYRIVRLFQGQIVTEAPNLPAIIGGTPHFAAFEAFSARIGVIGWCARKSACDLFPPLSCYRCPFFRATVDVERHEVQLEQIVLEADSNVGVESDRMVALLMEDAAAIVAVIAEIRSRVGLKQKLRGEHDPIRKIKATSTRSARQ